MPTFKITTSTPSVHFDYYEVEAPTEKEAIDLIWSGEADSYDTVIEEEAMGLEIVDVIEIKKQDYTISLHIFNHKLTKTNTHDKETRNTNVYYGNNDLRIRFNSICFSGFIGLHNSTTYI